MTNINLFVTFQYENHDAVDCKNSGSRTVQVRINRLSSYGDRNES